MKHQTSVIEFLDRAAERFPDKTAVIDGDGSYTFDRLRKLSRALGTLLLKKGLTGRNIAVLLPKKASALIAFFGCLYGGCTYVPLDTGDAAERLNRIIEKVGAPLVITDTDNAQRVTGAGSLLWNAAAEDIDDAAIERTLGTVIDTDPVYIMHTSGSTGEPKGVVVPHGGVINFANWAASYMGIDENDVIALQSPFHFDASVFDVYVSLATGAGIVIMPDVLARFPDRIPEFLEENRVTCIFWVPGLLAEIANSGALSRYKMPLLKKFTFVGEVMPPRQLNMWIEANPDRDYINLYGPTEATVACTAYRINGPVDERENIPIGKAGDNMRLIVITEDGRRADVGETGEICILGSGLALGYYGERELTERVFVQNPLNKKYREIMYRTGDYGHVNAEGDIIFSGRRDAQVKIHGIRVELGDIENAAAGLEGVERTCALLSSDKKLLLFLQTEERRTQRQLRRLLTERLPRYMLPDAVFELGAFPLNKNGKIDRKQLLAMAELKSAE